MSDFDKSTERKAEEFAKTYSPTDPGSALRLSDAFNSGRNSAKESTEIFARAMEEAKGYYEREAPGYAYLTVKNAITAVKARGDWPLP